MGRPRWRESREQMESSAYPPFSTLGHSDLGQNSLPFIFLLRPQVGCPIPSVAKDEMVLLLSPLSLAKNRDSSVDHCMWLAPFNL